MRESIGSTWTFAIIMIFTLIFSGFLVLALAYSKAYKLKNEMTTIIEKYEGITITDEKNNMGSLNILNTYLNNSRYTVKGFCEDGDYGVNLEDESLQLAQSNQKYSYCISKKTNCSTNYTIFTITVFYDFNLPVIGHLANYRISGQTNEIYKAYINSNNIKC